MSGRKLFAADLGASGGKCFVGILTGKSLALKEIHRFSHEGTSFFIADRSGAIRERTYWDDIFIYRNIVDGLHTFRREFEGDLDSIGVDTWGADGQVMNADGEMLGKIHCYRDHRLDNMVEIVKKRMDPGRMYGITGIHFQPFNVSNQLHWFVENRSELLRPGCFFLPIPTVFNYYLAGARQVDSSWASVTQLMDAEKKAWSAEILAALRIPPEIMPRIVAPGTVVGELIEPLAAAVSLNRAKVVAVASHDTASAFAAAPVEDPDDALIISSGTWSLVGKLIPKPVTSPAAMAANVSNEGGVGNVRFLKNCMGTWLMQELRRAWRLADGKETGWPEITAMAESARPFVRFIDPDDPGFYNPANMEKAMAEYCARTDQPVPSRREEYARMVYESLALKYRMVNEQISSVCGSETKVAHIVGGGSRNELLNRFAADALGMSVVAGPEDATAVGNVVVQAIGLGAMDSTRDALALIKKAFPIREYRPADTKAWDKAYERFKGIVE